jgi:hypothetical protein
MGDYDYADEPESVNSFFRRFHGTHNHESMKDDYKHVFKTMAQDRLMSYPVWLNLLRTWHRKGWPKDNPKHDKVARKRIFLRFMQAMNPGPDKEIQDIVAKFYAKESKWINLEGEEPFELLIEKTMKARQMVIDRYKGKPGFDISGRESNQCRHCARTDHQTRACKLAPWFEVRNIEIESTEPSEDDVQPERLYDEVKALDAQGAAEREKNSMCYYKPCGAMGHYERNCPKKYADFGGNPPPMPPKSYGGQDRGGYNKNQGYGQGASNYSNNYSGQQRGGGYQGNSSRYGSQYGNNNAAYDSNQTRESSSRNTPPPPPPLPPAPPQTAQMSNPTVQNAESSSWPQNTATLLRQALAAIENPPSGGAVTGPVTHQSN